MNQVEEKKLQTTQVADRNKDRQKGGGERDSRETDNSGSKGVATSCKSLEE